MRLSVFLRDFAQTLSTMSDCAFARSCVEEANLEVCSFFENFWVMEQEAVEVFNRLVRAYAPPEEVAALSWGVADPFSAPEAVRRILLLSGHRSQEDALVELVHLYVSELSSSMELPLFAERAPLRADSYPGNWMTGTDVKELLA